MVEAKGQTGIPEVELSDYTIDQEVLKLVPAAMAEKYKLIPLFKVGTKLTVAMAESRNIIALDELRNLTKLDISIVKSNVSDIENAISEHYGISGVVETLVKAYTETAKQPLAAKQTADAPVVKLVNVLLMQAIKERASDIHIEPEAKTLRVRYRVDGILHAEIFLPPLMLSPIVSRIKVLSGLDIAESRVPQDGRFQLEGQGKGVDLRVSTFPSVYGEKVVLRILDKSAMLYRLSQIGFSESNLAIFDKVIRKPHGVVLVTGPTGSGKTTTLYSALAEINSKELNIMTIEDPIEYELEGITQAQVNVKAGLTFATALRSMLRQDPDVILIGEIRDLETAEIAVQAAMTGHLVLSTLHTNDAVGALTRLTDIGVEPFLISSSVEVVMAQRLVRIICSRCKEETEIPQAIKEQYPDLKKVYRGAGCRSCKNSGYKGRTGIFELLLLDEKIRKLVTDKRSSDEIKKYAVSQGMKTLFVDGMEKVRAGITSLEEILRVTELEQV